MINQLKNKELRVENGVVLFNVHRDMQSSKKSSPQALIFFEFCISRVVRLSIPKVGLRTARACPMHVVTASDRREDAVTTVSNRVGKGSFTPSLSQNRT